MSGDIAYSRELVIPASQILRDFLAKVAPCHAQIAKLEEMNEKLRAARDLLLPRLMSGELAV
jgi:type I restriction enzyme S subunit